VQLLRFECCWIDKLSTFFSKSRAQVAPGGCGCPIPGGIQGQVECGPKQPDLLPVLAVGNPAHGREVGISSSLRSLPTQTIL